MDTRESLESLVWDSDTTVYDRIGTVPASSGTGAGFILPVPAEALEALAREAFARMAFLFPERHLGDLSAIGENPLASENDRATVADILENAVISSKGILPSCQDTGSAQVLAWKGQGIMTPGGDEAAISRGVETAYRENHLRKSILAAQSMLVESNTGTNLPASIGIKAGIKAEYRFYFCAKGGGSSNKTMFFQETKALLTETNLKAFLREKITSLGCSACPPYHIAVVVGGLSPEQNLETLKLATMGALDDLDSGAAPDTGSGMPFRCPEWEAFAMETAAESGLGAQFGGMGFALSARIIRLPRHAASLPVSIGVSCVAHRSIRGKITKDGIFLERLESNPARFDILPQRERAPGVSIQLDDPLEKSLGILKLAKPGDPISVSGPLILARDAAHARFMELIGSGKKLPEYLFRYPVYYAGPSETPPGAIIGSLGPTTAGRMDACAVLLMEHGASLVTLAKGNRSPGFLKACGKYGGIYLGTIGGAAALLSSRFVVSQEIVDYPELGMEAVRLVRVRDMPSFVLVDATGTGFYETRKPGWQD